MSGEPGIEVGWNVGRNSRLYRAVVAHWRTPGPLPMIQFCFYGDWVDQQLLSMITPASQVNQLLMVG